MIHNLKHINIGELYNLDQDTFDDYMELKKLLLINDEFFMKRKARNLNDLTYGEVGQIKRNVKDVSIKGIAEIFHLIYGIRESEFMNANVVDYFYALKYIEDQIVKLLEKENKVLSSDPDPEMEIAGSKKLQIFGEVGTMINLGRSFGMDPQEIENWKYGFVFMILAYDKTYSEVQKRYREIKKGRN